MQIKGDLTVRAGILAFAKLTGRNVREVATDVFRSAVVNMQKWTPPGKQSTGKAAIDRDLRKIFNPDFDHLPSWEATADGAVVGTAYKLPSGGVVLALPEDVVTSEGEMHSIHKAARRANGRTRGLLMNVKHGNYWHVSRKVVRGTLYRRYRRKVWQGIGKAKAGFNPAVEALGGTVRGNWLTRHGNGLGRVSVNIGNDGHGRIEVVNLVPYSGRKLSRGAVNRAMNSAGKALFRKVRYEIRQNQQKAGLGRS